MRAPQRGYLHSIANPRLLRPIISRPVDLRVFEDRRMYGPVSSWPRRVSRAAAVPASVAERPRGWTRQLSFSFVGPRKVLICVRRKTRREVLFATRRTRRGSASSRRRNSWSDVRC